MGRWKKNQDLDLNLTIALYSCYLDVVSGAAFSIHGNQPEGSSSYKAYVHFKALFKMG